MGCGGKMAERKLQVFVSSTYSDLVEFRLAAIEKIFACRHIPAAMEAFAPDDETVWNKIVSSIEESDVFLLILGGCYGSRLRRNGRSYVEREYDLAIELGKPRLLLIADDAALKKMGKRGSLDLDNHKYRAFKNKLKKDRRSVAWTDKVQLKEAISTGLASWASMDHLAGWVRGNPRPSGEPDAPISEHPYRRIVRVDERDRAARAIAFDVAHRNGLLHRVVHIEIYSDDKRQYLIFRRNEIARRMEIVGGHVNWLADKRRSETYIESCVRELKEELSLVKNTDLNERLLDSEIKRHLYKGIKEKNEGMRSDHRFNREWVQVFRFRWPRAWKDPALPSWHWNEEIIAAYWASDQDILELSDELANTALRMFKKRLRSHGKTETLQRGSQKTGDRGKPKAPNKNGLQTTS